MASGSRNTGALLLVGALLLINPGRGEAAPARKPGPATRLTFPGRPWSLVLDLPGFALKPQEKTRDGIMIEGENARSHLVVSIFLEDAARTGDAIACRKYYWKKVRKSPLTMDEVALFERDGMALVEYLIPEFQGLPVQQKNVNAYLSHDGVWIDIHLSKVLATRSDQALFDAVLRSVRIEGAGATRP